MVGLEDEGGSDHVSIVLLNGVNALNQIFALYGSREDRLTRVTVTSLDMSGGFNEVEGTFKILLFIYDTLSSPLPFNSDLLGLLVEPAKNIHKTNMLLQLYVKSVENSCL